MPLAIIKYNAGNIQSVMFALERLGVNAVVTDNISQIQQANKVIFPGVGEASSAMQYLRERGLDQVIRELHQPVLGICLGMQLLCSHSEENDTSCLDIVPVQVRKFISESGEGRTKAPLKVPQVGWNNIYSLRTKLFDSVLEDSFIYNVHSYYAESSKYSIASCEYGVEYAAAVRKDNFYGVQFHAEKSAGVGAQILKNFIEL
ncbi:MAG: imidazole glycerol phosphate synthase subunit HisH [Chitinophagaceae bacterium]|nr:imidazole glycerol phosphate synthase subunit HisH [Chitinophagaceae bacterium]